ncbi:putative RNA-directed RNA polymerase [Dioscorea sansibarensis]
MAGKTIKIYGLPIDVTATDVKEFLERYVEEGSVVAVKLRLPEVDDRSSKAFAVVQFSTSEHAREISVLTQRRLLMYNSFTLITRSAKHDIVQKLRIPLSTLEVPMLHLGCPISSEEFSVLWSFDSSQSYKLELSHKNIWEIKLLRCHKDKKYDKEKKFLLIQVKAAPCIYEGPEQNSGTLYEDTRLNYFKDIPDDQWIRTTDFTPLCSIGQSSAFCLQLPSGCTLPNIGEHFVCYKEVDGPFHLPRGSSFSRSLHLVPIVEPSPGIELPYKILFKINHMVQNGTLMGPSLDEEFYRLVSPCFKPIDHIERALEDMPYLKSSCLNPANWLYEKYHEFQTLKHDTKSSMISLDSGLVYVQRVQVTPSKVYFYGPEINVSNRVMRHFSEDIDNFMRISFVDEDCEKMRSTDLSPRSGNEKRTSIYKRILSTMRNGICIGDKKFEFLAYSSSQLRENSAWMFASRPGLTAADVREWLGGFRKIRNVAKYAARLGHLSAPPLKL